MPAVTINPKLTAAGLAAAVSAAASGLSISLTHIAFGSGQYTPALDGSGNATQTTMVARKEKAPFGAGAKTSPLTILLSAVFPVYIGTPYNVGEIGIYAGDPDAGGILFAIYSTPTYIHTFRNDQLEIAESYGLTLNQVPSGSVTVTVDPDSAAVLNALAELRAEANPFPQYLLKANNLSDLASVTTARSNLGLGSAAVQNTSAFDAAGTAAAAVAAALAALAPAFYREWVIFDKNGVVQSEYSTRAGVTFNVTGTNSDFTITPSAPFPSVDVGPVGSVQNSTQRFCGWGVKNRTIVGSTTTAIEMYMGFDTTNGSQQDSDGLIFVGFMWA